MTNKELGELSEKIAYLHEIARLGLQKGTYLVKLVSDNTKLGYDIESIKDFDSKEPIFIEVKTLNSDKSFIVTENEVCKLKALGDSGYIYLVSITENKVVTILKNPFSTKRNNYLDLQPIRYKAKIK